jgi:hypothetical protein
LIGSVDSASAGIVTASAGEVASLDQITISGSSYNASFNSSNHVLRVGAGSFTLETAVATVATGKLKSGQKVSFKITEQGNNTLTSGASFTAGGKTLTNSSTSTQQSITVEATSDANGDVSLPVTYTGLASADQVTVQAFAVPASTGSALIAAGTTRTLTGQSSIAATVVDEITSAGATASVRYVVRGGTVSIPVQVVDQFGQVPTGTFRLGLTYTNVSGTDVAPGLTTPVAVVNGKATVNVIDNSSDARVFTVTSTLAKLNADGVTWETGTTAGFEAAETVVSRISSGAAAVTVGSIALSASSTNNVNRAGKTLASGNSDLGAIWNSPTKAVDLTTSVAANTGAAVPGAAVTFSAAGVLFKANNVFGLGSLVVNSASDGTLPTVEVYSNLVGDVTITATSAGVSKTQVIKFATPTSGGASWAVTAPTNILPGQSLRVTATLRDKFGGAVNTSGTADTVKVEYTGPGFVTAAMPTTTNASGQVSFTVLLGAADSGTATVKITYAGADNITAATATDDVVSTTSITIGAAPVAAPAGAVARIAGSTNRFFVSVDGNTLARNVVVRVAGRSFATLKGSATNRSYAVRAPKGSHKVTVFVGGKLIATKTITVR